MQAKIKAKLIGLGKEGNLTVGLPQLRCRKRSGQHAETHIAALDAHRCRFGALTPPEARDIVALVPRYCRVWAAPPPGSGCVPSLLGAAPPRGALHTRERGACGSWKMRRGREVCWSRVWGTPVIYVHLQKTSVFGPAESRRSLGPSYLLCSFDSSSQRFFCPY